MQDKDLIVNWLAKVTQIQDGRQGDEGEKTKARKMNRRNQWMPSLLRLVIVQHSILEKKGSAQIVCERKIY